MERLARAVKLAAAYRENSYTSGESVEVGGVKVPYGTYSVSLWEAADRAAQEVGFDERGSMPVYLMLQHWNDALDWVDTVLPKEGPDARQQLLEIVEMHNVAFPEYELSVEGSCLYSCGVRMETGDDEYLFKHVQQMLETGK